MRLDARFETFEEEFKLHEAEPRQIRVDLSRSMVWFGSCPRCHAGDVVLMSDMYGWYIDCVQCSYTKDMDDPQQADALVRHLRVEGAPVATTA